MEDLVTTDQFKSFKADAAPYMKIPEEYEYDENLCLQLLNQVSSLRLSEIDGGDANSNSEYCSSIEYDSGTSSDSSESSNDR